MVATHGPQNHGICNTLNRKGFAMCLGLATELLGLVARQTDTNPTYYDLQDMMDMQSNLEDKDFQMNEDFD